MKTKPINKADKKRSLSETSIKSDQVAKEMLESKKNPKKAKNDNTTQNGNPVSESTGHVLGRLNRRKRNKKGKQINDNSNEPSETEVKIDTAKKTTLATAELDEKTLGKAKKTKLENLKKRQLQRQMQKAKRKEMGTYNVAAITLSVEEIKKRIAEIQSRETLSKTAKRKLAIFKRKLRVQESGDKSETLGTTEKSNLKDDKAGALAKNKANDKDKIKQKELVKTKDIKAESEEDDQDDSHVVEDTEDEDESDEDLSDMEDEEEQEVEEEEDENEDEDEDEEEEDTTIGIGEQSDDESDEDEEDEEDTDEEVTTTETKKEKKKEAAQINKLSGGAKKGEAKERHVLFVGNLPFDITENELKQHFLTKINSVTSVRIPTKPGTKTSRGFAYVDIATKTDYEKALSLHHTLLKKRTINVQRAVEKKTDVVAKYKKPETFHKTGKFGGNQGKKKPFKKMN